MRYDDFLKIFAYNTILLPRHINMYFKYRKADIVDTFSLYRVDFVIIKQRVLVCDKLYGSFSIGIVNFVNFDLQTSTIRISIIYKI